MALNRRKTAAIALVIAGAAGLSIASAAQLNLNTQSLGAGDKVVAACQSEPISVEFENTYTANGYATTGVKLGNIQETCNGLNFKMTVLAGGTEKEASGTVKTGSTSVALTGAPLAKDVTGVAVVIYG